jgi:2-dehydro-3-deoxygluconokinase
MSDIVTFGEAMVRLSPPDRERLEQASSLDMRVGGAELNVSVGAARLGVSASWVSRLPENPLGRFVNNQARQFGVDTSHMAWSPDDRMGVYFIEFGAAPRATSVLYDRRDSAFAKADSSDFDWSAIFADAKVFHATGITPALSSSVAHITIEAMKAAKAAGLLVSFDPNYRAKLWSREQAADSLVPLLEYVDILVTNGADAAGLFGAEAESDIDVAKFLAGKYHIDIVAIPGREQNTAWGHSRRAVAYADGTPYTSREYHIEMVDTIGGGDSFTAAFLCGIIEGDIAKALEYGVAFAALKHTNPGDLNYATREELEQVVEGAGLHIGR